MKAAGEETWTVEDEDRRGGLAVRGGFCTHAGVETVD